jgi:hypothetical protein
MPARTSQTDAKEHSEHENRNTPAGPKHLKVVVLGHIPHLEVPDQFLAEFLPFLAS